ncbi:MAG: beta-N-acetylhexosaminidase [Rhodospirillales bacterium]|nr:beta-N-acetylhexosaminidase [Rhodospirillales bacterium]
MSGLKSTIPSAAIFGCAGFELTSEEVEFFGEANPLGFILFQRNSDNPEQVKALVKALRASVGRDDAPVLIDQEGGRVARLKPPHWREAPAAARFIDIARKDKELAAEAAYLNSALLAEELRELGITVDCAPVLDLPQPGADPIIGDRIAGDTPELSALLGDAACQGFLSGGVLPVIKHIPGHGRAMVDSHKALPIVDATPEELEKFDFEPFRALASAPWAMTAHVVFTAFDKDHPATSSPSLIKDIIRGSIGFDGVLISDDLSMKALQGSFEEKARTILAAGCDLVLHCNGDMLEMVETAKGLSPLTPKALERVEKAEKLRATALPSDFPTNALERLNELLSHG